MTLCTERLYRSNVSGLPVVALRGRLDPPSSAALVEALEAATTDHRCIGLDLGEVESVAPRSLPVLLRGLEDLRSMRRHVRIVAASPPVHTLLERTGLSFLEATNN